MQYCKKKIFRAAVVFLLFAAISGCASFRSDLEGEFPGETVRNAEAASVNVLFMFSHVKYFAGFDAIPKLEDKKEKIRDFEDMFGDALSELSNIESYATFTNYSTDVNDPQRRALKDSLITANDYMLDIRIQRTYSFAKFFLGQFVSTVSLTTIPVPYTTTYSVNVDLYRSNNELIKKYSRSVKLTKWAQAGMVFLQPFYLERKKKEEIYIEFFHDIFRQIETEQVLEKRDSDPAGRDSMTYLNFSGNYREFRIRRNRSEPCYEDAATI